MSDLQPNIGSGKVFNTDESPVAHNPTENKKTIEKGESSNPGVISKHIGTGNNAKDSFVWMTLRSCFWIAGICSVGAFSITVYRLYIYKDFMETTFIDDLKNLWSIFTPIITLALGYAFGKRDNK